MKLIPTILCGGNGARLWPLSRQSRPKPFIALPDGETLLQKTYARAAALPGVTEIVTVAGRAHYFLCEDERRKCDADMPTRFLLEPIPRNTAAAIAVAALEVQQAHGDDAILLVLPADHVIMDTQVFQHAVTQAMELAMQGKLVTFGIRPTRAETGFGYIETENAQAVRFIEKPDVAQAKTFLAASNYFWNAGMFCFTAHTMLQELQHHAPQILRASREALESATRRVGAQSESVEFLAEDFARIQEISIDYALMERTKNLSVVPCDMGWSDIGSWAALSEVSLPADTENNRVQGSAVLHDTRDCYIHSTGRMIGCVGLERMVIVETSDAIVVAPLDRAQEVKQVFAALEMQGHEAVRDHATSHRPWGSYTVIERGAEFKIKRIEVKPGGQLSLQSHHHRSEHWVVLKGVAHVTRGTQRFTVLPNQSTYIPAGEQHRLSNRGKELLVMIEIQTGDYIGEDDIRRFADAYGREVEFG